MTTSFTSSAIFPFSHKSIRLRMRLQIEFTLLIPFIFVRMQAGKIKACSELVSLFLTSFYSFAKALRNFLLAPSFGDEFIR